MIPPAIKNAWYIGCLSSELKEKPIAKKILNTPIVFFRSRGKATALLDRCPHRNVPLSVGKILPSGNLQCAYHGWCFNQQGVCENIPALGKPSKNYQVTTFEVIEQQGYVWIYLERDPAKTQPWFFLENKQYQIIRYDTVFEAPLFNVAENILDVPHTAFLHAGLFRKADELKKIKVKIDRQKDFVQAQYIGETRPSGLLGLLLAPKGGTIEHTDSFHVPSVAQVEYRLDKNHLLITNILVPIDEFNTHVYTVVHLHLPLQSMAKLFQPFAKHIADQDARILKMQSDAILNGAQFTFTKADVLGPHIIRLLKQTEFGDGPEIHSDEVELWV